MTNFWQKLPKPFTVLAPMESVTDMAFREMVAVNLPKPDVFFTEFINADAIVHGALDKLKYSEKQRPIVAQIWGTNLINLKKAAKIVQDLGFDGIDINMGCPDKDVVKTGGGAALIKNPELAIKIIEAVKKGAPNLPISVKTRLGFNFELLLKSNLQAISIHGRTPKQLSKGKADWKQIGEVVKLSKGTIIIGNGDVKSYAEVLEKHKTYGVNGVMIGRGIFKDPLVFDKNSHSLTKDQRIELLEKHLELIKIHGGAINSFLKMYLNGFPGAKAQRILYN
ncbi:MAG: tRNA-dihydrouridine synthase family protein [bacterium]|nr:tRNA-dihydrouridine synthase family protein [bacterium]